MGSSYFGKSLCSLVCDFVPLLKNDLYVSAGFFNSGCLHLCYFDDKGCVLIQIMSSLMSHQEMEATPVTLVSKPPPLWPWPPTEPFILLIWVTSGSEPSAPNQPQPRPSWDWWRSAPPLDQELYLFSQVHSANEISLLKIQCVEFSDI